MGRINSAKISKTSPFHLSFFTFDAADTLTQGTEDYLAYADANPPERWLKFNDTHIEEVEMTDEFLQQECFGGTYLAEVPGELALLLDCVNV